jgi:serine-type D-Ala-D-Ala carboxypeptidase (penicillin-binding protein 5/6)
LEQEQGWRRPPGRDSQGLQVLKLQPRGWWLVFGLFWPGLAAALDDPYPDIAAAYLVRVDGRPLWGHEVDASLPPASLTKLMTALLVAERGQLDAVATVGPGAAKETGSRLGLVKGERLKVHDLLAATLLRSANDACHALADWHSGSEARFVARMNERASQLGLHHTHYANACGHDDPQQRSSAADLAALADALMARPELADLVRRQRLVIQNVAGRRFDLANRNALIGAFDGAIGIKTGYTPEAGPCIVALAERRGVRVMAVLLRGRDRWWDVHALLAQAFVRAGVDGAH